MIRVTEYIPGDDHAVVRFEIRGKPFEYTSRDGSGWPQDQGQCWWVKSEKEVIKRALSVMMKGKDETDFPLFDAMRRLRDSYV